MLQAYINDGGLRHTPIIVHAGYVARSRDWLEFSQEWQRILSMSPSIKYFKMDEAMNFAGEFSCFSEEGRNEKIILLKDVIDRFSFSPLACCLPVAEFETLIGQGRDIPERMQEQYYYVFFGFIAQIIKHQKYVDIFASIDWIFEEKVRQNEEIICGWETFKQSAQARGRLSTTPAFRDYKSVIPLQAADLLAWRVRSRWMEREAAVPPSPFPWDLTPIELPRLFVFEWNGYSLRQHVERARNTIGDVPKLKQSA
ncbi:MAG: hypothetical protein ACLP7P_00810 [Rhodomicrobium sp.]